MPADQAQQYETIGTKGVIGFYFESLDQLTGQDWVSQLANRFQSTQDTETYAGLGNVPQLREWLGGKNIKGFNAASLSITNKDWESTIRFKNKDLRRDKTDQVRTRIAELAQRALSHDAKLLSAVINAGTGTTVATSYDGKALFATDHVFGASGSINNSISVDISALPTGDTTGSHGSVTAPSVGELALSIAAGIKQLYGFVDDQGEPINEFAASFGIMVPVGLSDVAEAAISSVYLAQGMSNPTLVQTAPSGAKVQKRIMVNPRLTFTDKFAIFRLDAPFKSLIVQSEMDPQMKALTAGSDHEFFNNEQLFSIEKSGNVGIGRFDQACLVTMT